MNLCQTSMLCLILPAPSQMVRPFLGWDFKGHISSIRKGSYILRDKTGLELKGGIYPTKALDGSPALLFLGSPRLDNIDDLTVGICYDFTTPTDGLQAVFTWSNSSCILYRFIRAMSASFFRPTRCF